MLTFVFGFCMLCGNNVSQWPDTGMSADSDWSAYRAFRPLLSEMQFSDSSENKESIILPLKRAGNLILVEAIVDSVRGNLILDTGSEAFVLNSMYFRQGRKNAALVSGGITGSVGTVVNMRVNSLQISELHFSRVEAGVIDMGHIERAKNTKILGFFGLGLFADYEVVIDLQNAVLELHRLNFRGNRVHRPQSQPRYDLNILAEVHNNVVFIDGAMNNFKLTLCLDTGAESNVLTSGLPGRVLSGIEITSRSILQGAGAQQSEVLYGQMNNFSIDRKNFSGMKVIVTNMNAMSKFYGMPVHGMLGCEFLEKGTFHINLKLKRVGIIFNK